MKEQEIWKENWAGVIINGSCDDETGVKALKDKVEQVKQLRLPQVIMECPGVKMEK